jgi:GNAT superfamily N-acetyltransferase
MTSMTAANIARFESPAHLGAQVRGARPEELRAVFGMLIAAYVEHQWVMPGAAFRIHLGDVFALRRQAGSAGFLVAERNGRLLGAAMCDPRPARHDIRWPEGWASLVALAVIPEARWQGVGSTLLAACAARVGEQGASTLCLHASEVMTSSVGFAETMGLERAPALDFDLGVGHGLEPGSTVTMRAYRLALT